jgi:hypothetical protein
MLKENIPLHQWGPKHACKWTNSTCDIFFTHDTIFGVRAICFSQESPLHNTCFPSGPAHASSHRPCARNRGAKEHRSPPLCSFWRSRGTTVNVDLVHPDWSPTPYAKAPSPAEGAEVQPSLANLLAYTYGCIFPSVHERTWRYEQPQIEEPEIWTTRKMTARNHRQRHMESGRGWRHREPWAATRGTGKGVVARELKKWTCHSTWLRAIMNFHRQLINRWDICHPELHALNVFNKILWYITFVGW